MKGPGKGKGKEKAKPIPAQIEIPSVEVDSDDDFVDPTQIPKVRRKSSISQVEKKFYEKLRNLGVADDLLKTEA